MNNLKISYLTKEDLDEVLEINNLSFKIPWSLESIKNELKNKFAKYIVIKKNNLVIGFAGMWFILDEAHITNIAIHPKYRGINAGNMLMEGIITISKKFNLTSITLEVRNSNIIAQNLYKKYGFKEEGIRKKYYSDNEDAIIMWKHNI